MSKLSTACQNPSSLMRTNNLPLNAVWHLSFLLEYATLSNTTWYCSWEYIFQIHKIFSQRGSLRKRNFHEIWYFRVHISGTMLITGQHNFKRHHLCQWGLWKLAQMLRKANNLKMKWPTEKKKKGIFKYLKNLKGRICREWNVNHF